jgi:hypothetical protein
MQINANYAINNLYLSLGIGMSYNHLEYYSNIVSKIYLGIGFKFKNNIFN